MGMNKDKGLDPRTLTPAKLRAWIESQMEPTEPADSILRALRENNGKRLDKRTVERIGKAAGVDVRKAAKNGFIEICWGEGSTQSMIVANSRDSQGYGKGRTSDSPIIDAEYVRERNPAIFQGRDDRNHQRRMMLHDRDFDRRAKRLCELLWTAMTVREQLQDELGFGGPWSPHHYELRSLAGLD